MHLKGYSGEPLNIHREKRKTNNKRTVFDAGSPISQLKGFLPLAGAFQLKKKREKKRGGYPKHFSPLRINSDASDVHAAACGFCVKSVICT